MASIFKVHPTGLSTIEFGRSASQAVGGYYSPTDSLNLNEKERIEILYSETKLGGQAIRSVGKLVDVEFVVFMMASTKDALETLSHNLNKAIMNPKGGRIEFRPHGNTISTFYYYEASQPYELADITHNKWDWEQDFHNNQFVRAAIVTLKTKPYGTSDVYETVTPTRSTVQNATYGTYYNYFDLPTIKGDLPAIFQLRVRHLLDGIEINRLMLCTRSSVLSTLSNVVQTLQAENGTGVGAWSTQNDATRSGGRYMRLSPAANDTYYQLRIPIQNESDHRGLVGMLAVIRPSNANFTGKVGYALNGNEIWTDTTEYTPEFSNQWQVMYLGEHHLPPLGIADNETLSNPQLSLHFKTSSGGTVDVDCVFLFFGDETVAQYDFDSDRNEGISYSEKFVVQTNKNNDRVAQVTDLSNNVLRYVRGIYGSVFLEARDTTRVFMLMERAGGTHNPYDQASIEVKVLYRTIAPFGF